MAKRREVPWLRPKILHEEHGRDWGTGLKTSLLSFCEYRRLSSRAYLILQQRRIWVGKDHRSIASFNFIPLIFLDAALFQTLTRRLCV